MLTSELDKILEKVIGFARLPDGWNYGLGKAPSEEHILRAVKIISALQPAVLSGLDAFPGTDGELMIAVYAGSSCIEILLEVDGRINLVTERDGMIADEQNGVIQKSIPAYVGRFVDAKWGSSDYSIQNILTKDAAGSRALRSRTPRVAASRLYVRNASLKQVSRSAVTSVGTIRNVSRVNLQFLGVRGRATSLRGDTRAADDRHW